MLHAHVLCALHACVACLYVVRSMLRYHTAPFYPSSSPFLSADWSSSSSSLSSPAFTFSPASRSRFLLSATCASGGIVPFVLRLSAHRSLNPVECLNQDNEGIATYFKNDNWLSGVVSVCLIHLWNLPQISPFLVGCTRKIHRGPKYLHVRPQFILA